MWKTIIVKEVYPSGNISFRVYYKILWFMSKSEYVNGIFNRFPSLSDAVEAVKREIVQSKRVAKKWASSHPSISSAAMQKSRKCWKPLTF